MVDLYYSRGEELGVFVVVSGLICAKDVCGYVDQV